MRMHLYTPPLLVSQLVSQLVHIIYSQGIEVHSHLLNLGLACFQMMNMYCLISLITASRNRLFIKKYVYLLSRRIVQSRLVTRLEYLSRLNYSAIYYVCTRVETLVVCNFLCFCEKWQFPDKYSLGDHNTNFHINGKLLQRVLMCSVLY